FSADPRQNAVIIRDRQANMPIYRSLITQLDQRPIQIEISVTIIDVDAGDISQLGVDWSASASIGGTGVSFNSTFAKN
ncbi:secretin N-terminal domain-containing protein, partial [Klebsiella pneumoniae]